MAIAERDIQKKKNLKRNKKKTKIAFPIVKKISRTTTAWQFKNTRLRMLIGELAVRTRDGADEDLREKKKLPS